MTAPRRTPAQMARRISETCPCGARMTYEGEAPLRAADAFRAARKVCRDSYAERNRSWMHVRAGKAPSARATVPVDGGDAARPSETISGQADGKRAADA